MKFLSLILVPSIAFMSASCTSKTQYGDCVGFAEDKDPNLKYEISYWNVGVAIVCVELIAPPVLVLLDELSCPVGSKQ